MNNPTLTVTITKKPNGELEPDLKAENFANTQLLAEMLLMARDILHQSLKATEQKMRGYV